MQPRIHNLWTHSWQSQANLSFFLSLLVMLGFVLPAFGIERRFLPLYADIALCVLSVAGTAIAWENRRLFVPTSLVAIVAIALRWASWRNPTNTLILWSVSAGLVAVVTITAVLGTTLYITKNQGTTANLATDWEIHGQKTVASTPSGQFSKITPGQAFTDEWGIGQVLPLKKDMSQLAQLGLVGYDQWQVSGNGGNYLVTGLPVAASKIPYYSVHGIGFQANYILPAKDFVLFFKYYDEYSAKARVKGRTIAFGGSWNSASRRRSLRNLKAIHTVSLKSRAFETDSEDAARSLVRFAHARCLAHSPQTPVPEAAIVANVCNVSSLFGPNGHDGTEIVAQSSRKGVEHFPLNAQCPVMRLTHDFVGL
jgi:hypothetical protein